MVKKWWTSLPDATRLWVSLAFLPLLLPIAVLLAFVMLLLLPVAGVLDIMDDHF